MAWEFCLPLPPGIRLLLSHCDAQSLVVKLSRSTRHRAALILRHRDCAPPISKLPIAKTLLNLRNLAKRKTHSRNLVKLVFAKLVKFVFVKLAKHEVRTNHVTNAKQCETPIAKIAKVAKIELYCEAVSCSKRYNSTFTAGRETMLSQTH